MATLTASGHGAPAVLFNTTPSEPLGFYRLTGERVAVGRLVAFKAPASAFPYADRGLGYLRQTTLLKGVAGGPGDLVCAASGRLAINGEDRAPIAGRDRMGVVLPRWRGCRRLGPNELFVYSAHAPNSFDSRYFGPIAVGSVVGVYEPLFQGRGGG